MKMAGMGAKLGESSGKQDWAAGGARSGMMGKMAWVWSEPSSEEADELIRCYLEVADLPIDEVGGETKLWLAIGLLAKSLGRRVMAKSTAWEFRLHAGIKDEVSSFNLEHGIPLLFLGEERDAVL